MSNERLISFFSSWLVTALTLLVSSLVFVGAVVLGNDKVSTPMAAVLAGFIITLLALLVDPAISKSGFASKNKNLRLVTYLVANVIILWIVKRFALILGLGISSLVYVAILGVVLTLVQWGVVVATKSVNKRK